MDSKDRHTLPSPFLPSHVPGQRDCCPNSEGVDSGNRELALAHWFLSNQVPLLLPPLPPRCHRLHQRSLHPDDPVLSYFHPNSQSTTHHHSTYNLIAQIHSNHYKTCINLSIFSVCLYVCMSVNLSVLYFSVFLTFTVCNPNPFCVG